MMKKINMKCTATNHEKFELNSNDKKQTLNKLDEMNKSEEKNR